MEIEVFTILYNPGNTGNRFFPIFSYPGNTGNRFFLIFSYPGNAGGGRAVPGVVLCCLGLFLEHVPGKMNMVTLELRSKQALF